MRLLIKILTETIAITVEDTYNIAIVKSIICDKEGIYQYLQILIFDDIELEDSRTLASYNIPNESTLLLDFIRTDGLNLRALAKKYVYKKICRRCYARNALTANFCRKKRCHSKDLRLKSLRRDTVWILTETITITVEDTDTVENVKFRIEDEEAIYRYTQILIFEGTVLENCRTLDSYNITNDSTLHLDFYQNDGLNVISLAKRYVYKKVCRKCYARNALKATFCRKKRCHSKDLRIKRPF